MKPIHEARAEYEALQAAFRPNPLALAIRQISRDIRLEDARRRHDEARQAMLDNLALQN